MSLGLKAGLALGSILNLSEFCTCGSAQKRLKSLVVFGTSGKSGNFDTDRTKTVANQVGPTRPQRNEGEYGG